MQTPYETLELVRDGDWLTVWLNRPASRNALSNEMSDELRAVFDAVAPDQVVAARRNSPLVVGVGDGEIFVAGGMESMTNAPHMVSARPGLRYGDAKLVDHMAWDGLTNPYDGQAMGVFAEATVAKFGFTREEQDAFAVASQNKAEAAQKAGKFKDETTRTTRRKAATTGSTATA